MERIPLKKRRRPKEGELIYEIGMVGIGLTVDRIKEKVSLAQGSLRSLSEIDEEIGRIELALGHAGNPKGRKRLEKEIARARAEKKKVESDIARLEELLKVLDDAKEKSREAPHGGDEQQKIMQEIERMESELERDFDVKAK